MVFRPALNILGKSFALDKANHMHSGLILVELLVVLVILGILASAVFVAVNPIKSQQLVRDSQRKGDVGQLATALKAYSSTIGSGTYPASLSVLIGAGELKRIPIGPTGEDYTYTVSSTAATNQAAIYIPLEVSATPGASVLWCWRSSSGSAVEVTTGSCNP